MRLCEYYRLEVFPNCLFVKVCLPYLQKVISPSCNHFLASLRNQFVAYIYIRNVTLISKNESSKIKWHNADYGTEFVYPNTLYMYMYMFSLKFDWKLSKLYFKFC